MAARVQSIAMHPYSTDLEEKRWVIFVLAIASIVAAWLLPRVVVTFGKTVPWWLDLPSVLGFFGIFYGIFDRWLWRFGSRVPNLRGHWTGYVTSSFDKHATRREVRAEIRQTWSSMSISVDAEQSRSRSLLAGILTETPGGAELVYEYLNEPRNNAAGGMHVHRGVVHTRIIGDVLTGDYYTGRDRESNGTLHLDRLANR